MQFRACMHMLRSPSKWVCTHTCTCSYWAPAHAHDRMLQSTTGWLAGWLQVVMPAIRVSGCPVGLGLVGPSGSDEELLKLAAKLDKIVNA